MLAEHKLLLSQAPVSDLWKTTVIFLSCVSVVCPVTIPNAAMHNTAPLFSEHTGAGDLLLSVVTEERRLN